VAIRHAVEQARVEFYKARWRVAELTERLEMRRSRRGEIREVVSREAIDERVRRWSDVVQVPSTC
jgi:hypothetical protein